MTEYSCVKKNSLLAILILLLLTLCFIPLTSAAPPKIEKITWELFGNETWVTVEVKYQGSGMVGDGVDWIQVQVNGEVYNITIPISSYELPRETYVQECNVGVVTGTPMVQARAHGPLDGWGEWSSPVAIPEFPAPLLVLLFTSLIIPFVSLKLSNRKKS